MRKYTDEEIRKIQAMKNEANVAGLLMANPPQPHKDEKGGDDVQSHPDQEEYHGKGSDALVYNR